MSSIDHIDTMFWEACTAFGNVPSTDTWRQIFNHAFGEFMLSQDQSWGMLGVAHQGNVVARNSDGRTVFQAFDTLTMRLSPLEAQLLQTRWAAVLLAVCIQRWYPWFTPENMTMERLCSLLGWYEYPLPNFIDGTLLDVSNSMPWIVPVTDPQLQSELLIRSDVTSIEDYKRQLTALVGGPNPSGLAYIRTPEGEYLIHAVHCSPHILARFSRRLAQDAAKNAEGSLEDEDALIDTLVQWIHGTENAYACCDPTTVAREHLNLGFGPGSNDSLAACKWAAEQWPSRIADGSQAWMHSRDVALYLHCLRAQHREVEQIDRTELLLSEKLGGCGTVANVFSGLCSAAGYGAKMAHMLIQARDSFTPSMHKTVILPDGRWCGHADALWGPGGCHFEGNKLFVAAENSYAQRAYASLIEQGFYPNIWKEYDGDDSLAARVLAHLRTSASTSEYLRTKLRYVSILEAALGMPDKFGRLFIDMALFGAFSEPFMGLPESKVLSMFTKWLQRVRTPWATWDKFYQTPELANEDSIPKLEAEGDAPLTLAEEPEVRSLMGQVIWGEPYRLVDVAFGLGLETQEEDWNGN